MRLKIASEMKRVVRDIGSLGDNVGNVIGQVYYPSQANISFQGQRLWTPAMDVFETPEAYLVLAEVPGLNVGDIEVVVDRHHLRLSGTRHLSGNLRYRVHQAEIEYGSFQRGFRFPGPVVVDQVTAAYDNGLLTITLPKEAPIQTSVQIR